jgi:hypothetical protein
VTTSPSPGPTGEGVGGEGVHPAPHTFTTFTTFAKFAKFAKFATFDSAREHPTLIHRHAPRPGSISKRLLDAISPLPAHRERGWGEGFLRRVGGEVRRKGCERNLS